mgnify:CR=1 FL=1
MFNRKKYKSLPKEKKVGHYLSVPAWKQFIIIAAGVFMNFVLAWGIYSADFMFRPRNIQLPVVGQVIRDSVAFKAGIKAGDTIVKIDNSHIENWGELIIAKELADKHDANVLIKNIFNHCLVLIDCKVFHRPCISWKTNSTVSST